MVQTASANYLLLTEAIDTLRDALQPFVETQLKSTGPGWWKNNVLPNLSPLSRGKVPQQAIKGQKNLLAPLDVADLLQLILRNWATVFRGLMPEMGRSYASELYDTRNLWAHKGDGDVSRADLDRALDTVARLLDHVNKSRAGQIRAIKSRADKPTKPADEESGTQPATSPPAPTTTATTVEPTRHAPPPAANPLGLPSWRTIATPREDVRSGALSQGQFAADLAEVARGNPSVGEEYLDPREFFTRTYVTAGVRAFLKSALLRLNGTGGDPVIQLKTGFGGGKTHTMLALYHLAKSGSALAEHPALKDLFAETAGPPKPGSVAVLVGTHIDPTVPFTDDPELRSLGLQLNTLWGRLAWQLGGYEAYKMIQKADESGVAPGAETLRDLFTLCSPCLILIDELVAFARKLPPDRRRIPAGNFENTLSFIQSLTEAAKVAPQTVVAASIPESDMEIGGIQGQQALARIENTFGRVETPWTPVEATESFEVVRRRLFEDINQRDCDQVVEGFARLYQENRTDFPTEAREFAYEDRLRKAYPFHPELFDRLYEDWNAAIPNFQSTRGVLRLLAGAVQWLWQKGDAAPMIMPGNLPLESATVRDELMRYLPRGFQPVIEGDIDGESAEATAIDAQNPRFARAYAARAVARTIFLGSVPGKATQGIDEVRIRLGAAWPGEGVATYNDALGRLTQRLQFLYGSGSGRYWFDIRPNLTRTAADRMSRYSEDDVFRFLEERLKQDRDTGIFAGRHTSPIDTADVPDDTAARLVVIAPRFPHQAGAADSPAIEWAKRLLDTRGNSPRLNRNMLVFAALDEESIQTLTDQARQFLAWESIVREKNQLNLDDNQIQQATKNRDNADKKITTDLQHGYRWAIVPAQKAVQQGDRWTAGQEEWRTSDLAQGGLGSLGPVAQRVGNALVSDERLLPAWSPMFLKRELDRWFWSQGLDHISAKKLWEEFLCRYLYFPRLRDREVLIKAIAEGATSKDFFGYAAGVDDDGAYAGLSFGQRPGSVLLDGASVIVRKEKAVEQVEAAATATDKTATGSGPSGGDHQPETGNGAGEQPGAYGTGSTTVAQPKRFYGSVKLNPLRVGTRANEIADEVIKHLNNLGDAEVEVVLEVRAYTQSGLPEATVRTVGENARQLKFTTFEFEDE